VECENHPRVDPPVSGRYPTPAALIIRLVKRIGISATLFRNFAEYSALVLKRMLVDESVQTNREMERKTFEERVFKEGMELWMRQKEHELKRRNQERKEMKEMLENYWPWGNRNDSRPRGLRNLRLEELFPNKDYINAKRHVGVLDLGRQGGGAPIFSNGNKLTKTHEDPALRFQFGSKDLRKCVDNNLRYKTNRQQQQEYKKELDKLVEEKRHKRLAEKDEEKRFQEERGWSDERTLKNIQSHEPQETKYQSNEIKNRCDKISNENSSNKPSSRLAPSTYHKKNFIPVGRNRKLSPLSHSKDDGVELVTLLAKDRKYPPRIPLCSSDITSEKKMGNGTLRIWNRQGSAYLRALGEQMTSKQEKIKEFKANELEKSKQHFSTWSGFWGRPGNGAPLSDLRKRCLDNMLYPKMTPIGVH
ncbi:unnamed protein product, partial [Phyllotreta striolata]